MLVFLLYSVFIWKLIFCLLCSNTSLVWVIIKFMGLPENTCTAHAFSLCHTVHWKERRVLFILVHVLLDALFLSPNLMCWWLPCSLISVWIISVTLALLSVINKNILHWGKCEPFLSQNVSSTGPWVPWIILLAKIVWAKIVITEVQHYQTENSEERKEKRWIKCAETVLQW